MEGTAGADEMASKPRGAWLDPEVSARLDSVFCRDRPGGRASRSPGVAQPVLHLLEHLGFIRVVPGRRVAMPEREGAAAGGFAAAARSPRSAGCVGHSSDTVQGQ